MKALLKSTMLLTGLLSLTACSYLAPYEIPIAQGTVIDQEALDTLQPGLTKDQVQSLLGPSYGQNPYQPNHLEYVFYTNSPDIHPEAANHVVVEFDSEGYVRDWYQIKEASNPLAKD